MKADWGKLAKRVRGHLVKMLPEHSHHLSVAASRGDWALPRGHRPIRQTSFFACLGASADLGVASARFDGVKTYADLPTTKAVAAQLRDALMADLAARSGVTD